MKEETLQKLANRLRVPRSHFDPPASDSVHREINQPDDPLSLTLHKVDAERLAGLLKDNVNLQWQLNIHHVDAAAIPVLEQLEETVADLRYYLHSFDGSLRQQLDALKTIKHVASLLEELAKHGLAILGAEFLYWQYTHNNRGAEADPDPDGGVFGWYWFDSYNAQPTAVISVDEHSVQTRRASVDRGKEPPKFASDGKTIIVNGVELTPF